MAWAFWLAVPVVLTAVVAVLSWVRSRPVRTLDTAGAMREHAGYLDALVQTARAKDDGPVTRTGSDAHAATDRPRGSSV